MAVAMLRDLKYAVGALLGKGEVMQDLEYSMRSKGDFTGLEEARLQVFSGIATRGFATGAAVNGFMAWLITGSRKRPEDGDTAGPSQPPVKKAKKKKPPVKKKSPKKKKTPVKQKLKKAASDPPPMVVRSLMDVLGF